MNERSILIIRRRYSPSKKFTYDFRNPAICYFLFDGEISLLILILGKEMWGRAESELGEIMIEEERSMIKKMDENSNKYTKKILIIIFKLINLESNDALEVY